MSDCEGGWALISVLWVVSILAILVAAAQALSFNSAQREQRALMAAMNAATLDAAIVRAVVGISDPRSAARWRVDGVPQEFELAGETIRVTIQDELGRIDLNAADGSLLHQLLRSAGTDKEAADALTARILAWRAPGTGRSGAGGARGRAFQSVDELRLVPGVTSELFALIRPALTVYSRHPAIDTAVAPREALLAYYPNQPRRVADELKNRSDPARAGAFPGTVATGTSLVGRTFDLVVELPASRHAPKREAVIMLTNSLDRPYLVMAWR